MSKASVIFIHGAGGGGWEWNIWTRIFRAHGFDTYAPDLLPSANGLPETSLGDYHRQVQQYLLSMASPKVIVGASLGGLLTLMSADHADALVLINPMPPAPLHLQMPVHEQYPAIIPWQTNASLQSTRRALFDCDEMTCLFAFRHWRNESGAVMNAAMAGIDIVQPVCPVFVVASGKDSDLPFEVSQKLAINLNASFINLSASSHVGPLLGKNAAQCAVQAVAFLNGIFR